MTKRAIEASLSRREREIMDVLFSIGRATAQEIQQRLANSPSYSTVRTILRILERKGHLTHQEEGPRYVYKPSIARDQARKSALRRMLHTFFDGSAQKAVATLLDPKAFRLTRAELDELTALIDQAKEKSSK